MAKTASPELLADIANDCTTLTTIWVITRRDGVVVRLTELDRDVIDDQGNVYKAIVGYDRTAATNREGLETDSVEIEGILDDTTISRDDVNKGLFDESDLRISLINFEQPSHGTMALKRGEFGEFVTTPSNRFRAEVASLTSFLDQEVVERTSATCRAVLGDNRCKIPLVPQEIQREETYDLGTFLRVATAGGSTSEKFENLIYEVVTAGTTAASQPTYNNVAGQDTTDGTAVLRAYEAFTRLGVVSSVNSQQSFSVTVTEPRAFLSTTEGEEWFALGLATFETGLNANRSAEIKEWNQSSSTITVFLPLPDTINVGDILTLSPGCNRFRETCRDKFLLNGSRDFNIGNVLNFRGEPDLPGKDAVLRYPDAQ